MIKFSRQWAMPSANTFEIKPIKEFVLKYLNGISVDPFARDCDLATLTNDLNPDTKAQHHLDAEDFLLSLEPDSIDVGIFDPPYSPRQISECYKGIGRDVTGKDTQNAALYKRVRDALDRVMKKEGLVLSFGWNTSGMGLKRGYEIVEIMTVCHGGGHNDTLCVAERKL